MVVIFLKYEVTNVQSFQEILPTKLYTFHYVHQKLLSSRAPPWAVLPPAPYPSKEAHRNCVLRRSHKDCTLLTCRSPPGQEPGMQNPLQSRRQSHTMKNCPTQNTSSTAVKKLTALWNRIKINYSMTSHVLPKIHSKNPKIQPNTMNFIPL